MNPILRIAALLLPLSLAACATTTPVAQAPAVAKAPEAPVKTEPAINPRIPKLDLSQEWLYGLLAGEIVGQRGGAGVAAETYLQLARDTRDPRIAQRASEFAMFSGNIAQASAALSLWVELDPDAEGAREQLLIALLRSGKLAESQPLVEGMLKRQPDRAGAIFVQLARLLARQPDRAAAAKMVSDLAERYPDLPEARFAHLAVATEAGEQTLVTREFDRLAKIAPAWDLPVLWYADRLRRSSTSDAITFLQDQMTLRSRPGVELYLTTIRLLGGEKRYAEAQKLADKALQLYPKQSELLGLAGLLAAQSGQLANATRLLEGALQSGYSDEDALRYTLGQLADEQKQPALARKWYQQVEDGDSLLPARMRLAQLDAAEGRWQQAIDDLQALDLPAGSRERVVALQAQLAKQGGDIEQGIRLLDAGIQSMPRSPELLYDRALLAEQLGRFEQTEKDLRMVLQLVPDHTHALNALGYSMSNHTTRYKEALGYIEKAHKAMPEDPMILDSLGWAHFKLGQLDLALKYLRASYEKLDDAEVAAHLGEVLWRMGQKDEARKLWQDAAKKSPDHAVLRETMQRLLKP